MNKLIEIKLPAQSDLERVIEPLAGYICAADRPRAALRSALKALFSEVDRTNRAAVTRLGVYSEAV